MSWNRKEVAALLMTGAGLISAIQTAIFSKWVDAKLQVLSATGDVKSSLSSVLQAIEVVGLISTIVLSLAWVGSRFLMAKSLPPDDRLDWRVSALVVGVFGSIAAGWTAVLFIH